MIIEINEWDDPVKFDYRELAQSVSGVIIRVQSGMDEDLAFQEHVAGFKEAGVPVAISAVVKGRNSIEMAREAEAFWYRGRDLRPTFWWLEVPQETMTEMNDGLVMYRFILKTLGAQRVGICTTLRLYEDLGITRKQFTGIWIKDLETDEKKMTKKSRRYDLYQGLLALKCAGYDGWLNRVWCLKEAEFDYFFGHKNRIPKYKDQWKLLTGTLAEKWEVWVDEALADD